MATVEFFGTIRLRTEVSQLEVSATTVGDALLEVERKLHLDGLLLNPERLGRSHCVNLNGRQIVADMNMPIAPTDSLLIIAADPGG